MLNVLGLCLETNWQLCSHILPSGVAYQSNYRWTINPSSCIIVVIILRRSIGMHVFLVQLLFSGGFPLGSFSLYSYRPSSLFLPPSLFLNRDELAASFFMQSWGQKRLKGSNFLCFIRMLIIGLLFTSFAFKMARNLVFHLSLFCSFHNFLYVTEMWRNAIKYMVGYESTWKCCFHVPHRRNNRCAVSLEDVVHLMIWCWGVIKKCWISGLDGSKAFSVVV